MRRPWVCRRNSPLRFDWGSGALAVVIGAELLALYYFIAVLLSLERF